MQTKHTEFLYCYKTEYLSRIKGRIIGSLQQYERKHESMKENLGSWSNSGWRKYYGVI